MVEDSATGRKATAAELSLIGSQTAIATLRARLHREELDAIEAEKERAELEAFFLKAEQQLRDTTAVVELAAKDNGEDEAKREALCERLRKRRGSEGARDAIVAGQAH